MPVKRRRPIFLAELRRHPAALLDVGVIVPAPFEQLGDAGDHVGPERRPAEYGHGQLLPVEAPGG